MQFLATDATLPNGALLLDNTVDVLTDARTQADALTRHATVVLQFPKWTDGRAYSQASLLRGRLRYQGEIRAVGDVLVDMLPLLQRCGFSAVQMRADQSLDAAQRALAFFEVPQMHYQTVLPERRAAQAGSATP